MLDGRSRLLARVELRRSRRRLLDDPAALAVLAALAVAAGVVAGLLAAGVTLAGAGLRGLLGVAPTAAARAGLAGLWVGLTASLVSRTASITGRVDGADAVLLAVDHRVAVRGVVLAECGRLGTAVAPAALLSTAAVAETGGPTAVLTVPLTVALVVATAVVVAYPVGLAGKLAVEGARRRGIGWGRLLVVLAVPGSVLAAILLPRIRGADPTAIVGAVARLPPGWYADLLYLGVAPVDPVRAAAAVCLSVVVVAAGLLAAGPPAARLWYGDPRRAADPEHPGGLGSLPAPVSRPTAVVARVAWTRTLRAPVKLVYVLYPLGGIAAAVADPGTRGRLPAVLAVYVPLYGAWAAGAGLALNPLGDGSAGLPTTVLSTVPGRRFVRGHALAAALPGWAVGTAVLVAAVVVGRPGPLALVAGVALAGALSVTAGGLAALVGTRFPNFESIRVSATRRIVTPSFPASALYFLGLGALTAPGSAALLSATDLPTLLPAGPGPVAVATALQVCVAVAVVLAAERSAGDRFDRYRID